jgi:hypothetical protein
MQDSIDTVCNNTEIRQLKPGMAQAIILTYNKKHKDKPVPNDANVFHMTEQCTACNYALSIRDTHYCIRLNNSE